MIVDLRSVVWWRADRWWLNHEDGSWLEVGEGGGEGWNYGDVSLTHYRQYRIQLFVWRVEVDLSRAHLHMGGPAQRCCQSVTSVCDGAGGSSSLPVRPGGRLAVVMVILCICDRYHGYCCFHWMWWPDRNCVWPLATMLRRFLKDSWAFMGDDLRFSWILWDAWKIHERFSEILRYSWRLSWILWDSWKILGDSSKILGHSLGMIWDSLGFLKDCWKILRHSWRLCWILWDSWKILGDALRILGDSWRF